MWRGSQGGEGMNANKTIYISDSQTWEDAKRIASIRGSNVSAVIQWLLVDYVNEHRELLKVVQKATGEA